MFVPCTVALCACNNTKSTKTYSTPKKITDYLYEITYDSYTWDDDAGTVSFDEAFGCSSVRNGNYFGRNFDYFYNDVPEFLIRVNKSDKVKHASIGLAMHEGLREGKVFTYDKQLEVVPNITLDGINDAGVICSCNVVMIEQGNDVSGTNPQGKPMHMQNS